MVIGRFDGTGEKPRSVQGPKSKELHFESRVCRKCNSERTQTADREFDRLHQKCLKHFEAGKDPKEVIVLAEYAKDSASYFNIFRYFAKLLCCHIAEVQGPRPVHLSKFAISDFDLNFVWLDIGLDPVFAAFSKELGEHQYAAHGGLAIFRDRKSSRATGFKSTLTIGPIKYTFFTRFVWLQEMELMIFHRPFYDRFSAKIREAAERTPE
jgi:hypothetical protein